MTLLIILSAVKQKVGPATMPAKSRAKSTPISSLAEADNSNSSDPSDLEDHSERTDSEDLESEDEDANTTPAMLAAEVCLGSLQLDLDLFIL